jgi:hypothetical protein
MLGLCVAAPSPAAGGSPARKRRRSVAPLAAVSPSASSSSEEEDPQVDVFEYVSYSQVTMTQDLGAVLRFDPPTPVQEEAEAEAEAQQTGEAVVREGVRKGEKEEEEEVFTHAEEVTIEEGVANTSSAAKGAVITPANAAEWWVENSSFGGGVEGCCTEGGGAARAGGGAQVSARSRACWDAVRTRLLVYAASDVLVDGGLAGVTRKRLQQLGKGLRIDPRQASSVLRKAIISALVPYGGGDQSCTAGAAAAAADSSELRPTPQLPMMRRLWLRRGSVGRVCQVPPGAADIEVSVGRELILGRSRFGIVDPHVSRSHARLEVMDAAAAAETTLAAATDRGERGCDGVQWGTAVTAWITNLGRYPCLRILRGGGDGDVAENGAAGPQLVRMARGQRLQIMHGDSVCLGMAPSLAFDTIPTATNCSHHFVVDMSDCASRTSFHERSRVLKPTLEQREADDVSPAVSPANSPLLSQPDIFDDLCEKHATGIEEDLFRTSLPSLSQLQSPDSDD